MLGSLLSCQPTKPNSTSYASAIVTVCSNHGLGTDVFFFCKLVAMVKHEYTNQIIRWGSVSTQLFPENQPDEFVIAGTEFFFCIWSDNPIWTVQLCKTFATYSILEIILQFLDIYGGVGKLMQITKHIQKVFDPLNSGWRHLYFPQFIMHAAH